VSGWGNGEGDWVIRYVNRSWSFVFIQSVKTDCYNRMPFLSGGVHRLDKRVENLIMKDATWLTVDEVPYVVPNGFDGIEVVVVDRGKGEN